MLKQTKIITAIILIFSVFAPMEVYSKGEEYTVVIDAGHGGKDVGAVDNGIKEKDINLGVAKKLSGMIKKNLKNVKTVMTRDDDTYLTLQERANVANKNKGNLFISIHTNSIDKSNPNRNSIQGSSVYALGLHKDQNNLQVARRENSVIELESDFQQKYSGFDPSKDESYIIFEMAQKRNLSQSLKFANLAQKNLVSIAGRGDKGVKQAGFWVLWATSMPSVLVELDFICNPKSAEFLGSEAGQEKMAKALYTAVEKYFKTSGQASNHENELSNDNSVDKTPVLKAVQTDDKEMKTVVPQNSTAQRASNVARKRRSAASRVASEKRNVEATDIVVHSEDERLAVVAPSDNKEVVEKEPEPEVVQKSKDKKTKVKGAPQPTNVTPSYKPKQSHVQTIYKIQVLTSGELLKQNNPCFCGLTPIKSFKERGLYKYTYGESQSKEEIEKLLVEVRKKIPDAFIIKNMR